MGTATVDGSNGPGFVLDNVVFNNVNEITLISGKEQLRLVQGSNDVTYIDISTATTILVTNVAAGNYNVAIST